MISAASPRKSLSPRHVSAAAQNIAAAQFSPQGFDVLEQAGRSRYSHDLGVASPGGMMKIMVHGSMDGLWELIDPYLVKARQRKEDYHRAIDLWLERHRHTTCCLVQFDLSNLNGMPRIYLAASAEVADRLHENTEMLGETAVPAGYGRFGDADWEESLPRRWRFSRERDSELMSAPEGKAPVQFRISGANRCRDCAEIYPAKCIKCLPMMN